MCYMHSSPGHVPTALGAPSHRPAHLQALHARRAHGAARRLLHNGRLLHTGYLVQLSAKARTCGRQPGLCLHELAGAAAAVAVAAAGRSAGP